LEGGKSTFQRILPEIKACWLVALGTLDGLLGSKWKVFVSSRLSFNIYISSLSLCPSPPVAFLFIFSESHRHLHPVSPQPKQRR
jgi:hypothetical protein